MIVVPEQAALGVGVEAECCRRMLDELVKCGLLLVAATSEGEAQEVMRCRLVLHPWMLDIVFMHNADTKSKPVLISTVPRSRYTFDECRRFAEDRKAAGENVRNVGGLARHFHSRQSQEELRER